MLLRIAQADAYAAAVEFIKTKAYPDLAKEALQFKRYLKHPTHNMPVATYTDDTQMSIGVAEVMLSGEPITELAFANAWVRCFQRDRRNGYARGFQRFLESMGDGKKFLEKIISTSNKNGAAMRAVPIGLYSDINDVVEVALLQAKITHDSPKGTWAALAVALMSHFAHHTNEPWSAMDAYVNDNMHPDYDDIRIPYLMPYDGRIRGAVNTVLSVKEALQTQSSLMGILRQIIEWGGDTDSAAAIAWGIASARYPDEQLPDFMEESLEPGNEYGVQFLKALGVKLMERYG